MQLPEYIQTILNAFHQAHFEASIVGGCVRDFLRDVEPKDWDITTNALPKDIQALFPKSFYNNNFGTVGITTENGIVEVTPYRIEGKYTDKRHPDIIRFGTSLEEDLARRDFTINALSYDGEKIVDYWKGEKDLKKKILRAVGDPRERFTEDALRLMRAIRFASELQFDIEPKTYKAIASLAKNIQYVSKERIRDEFIKLIESDNPLYGMWLLHKTGLQKYIIPELEDTVGVGQNLHHIYSVFFHGILSLQYCPTDDYRIRIAALLHDVGKPHVKRGSGKNSTFHQHEYVGAKMARVILRRLKFSNEDVEKITHLIRHHMFYYSMGEITDSGVRRLITRIGKEHMHDALIMRIADRMGSGCEVEVPFKLKELQKRIEKVSKDPITTSMLAINGNDLIQEFKIKPGPRIGLILNSLLEEVLDDPKLNARQYLLKKAGEIHTTTLGQDDLEIKRERDKKLREKLSEINEEEEQKLNKKYFGK